MKHSKGNKTLAILGSPHKNGITAKMLDIAVNASKSAGSEVFFVNLYEKNIKFCTGCRKCLEARECIMKNDDISEITGYLKACDTVILASPVYWANVSAAVKNLFDRLNGTAMEETETFPKPRLSGKKYVLLTACSTRMPFAKIFGQSTGAIRAMKEFFNTSGMKCIGTAVCGNSEKIKELPEKTKRKINRFFK